MKQRIREFGSRLRGGGVGVFYYAGHGIQFNGRNYLLPVDIAVVNEADVEDAAVDLQLLLSNLALAENGLNIIILDACRNNPFEGRVRDARDGLAEVRAATGTLIAYATAPGSVASDGTGRNGAYTEALLKQLKQPGVEVLDLFRQVRESVYEASQKKQVPWTNESLIGKFYFQPGAPPAVAANSPTAAVTVDEKVLDLEFWNAVKDSNDPQEYKDYLDKFPNGQFAAIARRRAAGGRGGNNNPAPVKPPTNTRSAANQFGVEFVALPAGTFIMGSASGNADEKPRRVVTLSQPFELGKYEVTQEQWQAAMGGNPSNFKDCAKCPVENVSWDDAQRFIAKLNASNDGYKYRLPTEAEWEYAARAGTTGDYAGALDELGWYYENAGDKRLSDSAWSPDKAISNHNQTHPAGAKTANAWGLFDMHGNVWEWTQDWYDAGYYAKAAKTDPPGPPSGTERVARGGSWVLTAVNCRSSHRHHFAPNARYSSLGLRLARTR
jgi:formylglycine-generating enzyme required for sulfatase activity